MSVYVDSLMDWGWNRGKSCHLIADNLHELHAFAVRIGMQPSWFQVSNNRTPHYDLTEDKRLLAVKMGAIELKRKNFIEKIRELKN